MREPIALIGQTNFRNKRIPFGIMQRDRLYHMLLVGKTGSGKSTVLAQMMNSDLKNGVGFALLDAHGDLAEQVLGLVPEERIKDVVYINPAEPEFSPPVNLLDGGQRYLVISQFLSIFQHLWPEFWGPRTEYLLRNALLTLAETFPGASLAEVPKLLTDFGFREFLVRRLPLGDLRSFWESEFAQYSKYFRNEAVSPILNKLGAVTLNPMIRPILCRRERDLDFRKLMDRGGILIANLAKGTIGEDASALLGSVLLSKLILVGLSRSDVPESQRRFFGIYADEAQQFLTDSGVNLFAELRKFRVAGTWSAQYLAALPEKLREGILGNVGSQIVFALSGEDAEVLTQEFAPVVQMGDFVSVPIHHFYSRLKIDGVTSRPFSGKTMPLDFIPNPHAAKQNLRHFRNREPNQHVASETGRPQDSLF